MNPLDYDQWERAFLRGGCPVPVAEAHGLWCGLLTAGQPDAAVWSQHVAGAGGALPPEAEAVRDHAQTGLADGAWTLVLGLPGDDRPLRQRVEALGQWVGGYLSGLALAGAGARMQADAEARELLEDLAQIARVGDDGDDASAQEAYEELCEYVRVAVWTLRDVLAGGGLR